jgi:anaerobic selenocysteine-containing dehydrogenase
LLVAGGAPIPGLANTNKVREAFGRLEFMAVIDLFMTETAKCADVVLPAAFFLERDEIGIMPVNLQRKAVDGGECLPDWEIWMKLARRMGYEKYFYWQSFEDIARQLLQSVSMSYEELSQHPEGLLNETPPGMFLHNGFYTASGKIELYSQSLESCGYDPLPVYREPAESPAGAPEISADYPLILITGGRRHMYLHSQHRNIPSLRKLQPEPLVDIHPETAGSYGMADGDMALVESPRGTITIKVHCTEDILPGVVHIPHGWAEADCNVLTDHKNRDPVSGFPGLKSSLCRIKKHKDEYA